MIICESNGILGNRGFKREVWTGCVTCLDDIPSKTPDDEGYVVEYMEETYFKMDGNLKNTLHFFLC